MLLILHAGLWTVFASLWWAVILSILIIASISRLQRTGRSLIVRGPWSSIVMLRWRRRRWVTVRRRRGRWVTVRRRGGRWVTMRRRRRRGVVLRWRMRRRVTLRRIVNSKVFIVVGHLEVVDSRGHSDTKYWQVAWCRKVRVFDPCLVLADCGRFVRDGQGTLPSKRSRG